MDTESLQSFLLTCYRYHLFCKCSSVNEIFMHDSVRWHIQSNVLGSIPGFKHWNTYRAKNSASWEFFNFFISVLLSAMQSAKLIAIILRNMNDRTLLRSDNGGNHIENIFCTNAWFWCNVGHLAQSL